MEPIRMLQPTRPDARTVVIELPGVPGLRDIGAASESFGCPACGALLLDRVEKSKLRRLIFRCPECGTCSGIARETAAA